VNECRRTGVEANKHAMKERYLIEDMMSQGHNGVVFRATDVETGKTVALRRYFPFGRGYGGLDAEGRKAYEDSLGDLCSVRHESLAAVVGGGCDDVDGFPFIATEWIDAETLEVLHARATLGVDDVLKLLGATIDASLWLSQTFGREALWVETELATMLRRNSDKAHDYVFCISPFKWLGISKPEGDLKSLSGLASQLLHGVPHANGDAKFSGLVHWIEWLRVAPKSTTLTQARSKLSLLLQSSTHAPVRKSTPPQPKGKQPAPRKAKRPVRAMLWVNLFLALGTIAFGGYAYQVKQSREDAKKPKAYLKADKSGSKKFTAKKKKPEPRTEIVAGAFDAPATEVIPWDNHPRLMEHVRRKVTVEGPAGRIDQSKSGKTLYLIFFGGDKPESSRVGIRLGKGSPDATKSELAAFVGKKIRASGEVKKEMQGNLSSPAVMVNDVSAIQIID
jgi:hypothetical protein